MEQAKDTTRAIKWLAMDQGWTVEVAGQKPLTITVEMFPQEIRQAALLHGLKQKIADEAALSRDAKTGKSATPAEKYAGMVAMIERLKRGAWNERGTRTNDGELQLRAIAQFLRIDVETAKQRISVMATKRECGDSVIIAGLMAKAEIQAIYNSLKFAGAADLAEDILDELAEE